MQDSHGRIIDYLRVSLTDRCNLRCIYCMPEEGVPKKCHEEILRFEEVLKIINAHASLGIKKVRFTGGEPLILKGVDNLIYNTSKIPSIEDISITTNGILLYDMADDLKKAGLKRVNISLDTLKEDKYRQITRGGDIKKVLSAIEKCMSLGLLPVKLNVVAIKGVNDDETADFIRLTREMPISVRFIELMPIGEGAKLYEEGALGSEEIIESFPGLIPLEDLSGTAKLFKLENAKGTVGFISPLSCKFCNSCNKIRLTASGTIKPCLHSEDEIDIKSYVNDEALLTSVIRDAILSKPQEHHMETEHISRSQKMMYQIGG
ncbi:cyclic pyranopterin monophosphate synthase [Oxobacter pfennigii]|uniref:GTP 3',8-cyclase n=1 Tax=Oxobacter pfennigii TaxID=36849 RepID=A0A0P8W4M6_9CLOT|nr:GTP 3',8-cyclase MoaA [Oxobacter pfennigii]KPU42737.1 cyclic pyranopterin monophosphate synthase [Oxobacter pfennigii]